MKRKIFIIFVLVVVTLSLSGCGENYPRIYIYEKWTRDPRTIDMGNSYRFSGFDIESVEDGKNLIIHFRDDTEEDK